MQNLFLTLLYCDKKILKSFDAKLDGTISKSQKVKVGGMIQYSFPKIREKLLQKLIIKMNYLIDSKH